MIDPYLPTSIKPSLEQYDNYQIYDLYCVDILYELILNSVATSPAPLDKQQSWLAVQAYSPNIILCDFNTIANTYK